MRVVRTSVFIILLLLAAAGAWAKAGQGKAVVDVGEGSFTFGVISDCRSGDRIYAKIVEALAKRNPDFVVFVGDILPTMLSEKQWDNFQKLSAPLDVPFYLAPGNHDIEDEASARFWRDHVELPGRETYYSFTAGRSLFVVLNSNEPGQLERVTGEQLAWLQRTLDPEKYEHQFVFVHHPLFMWKGAFHEGEALDRHPGDRDILHRLFVEKKVDIVFSGHEHTYRRQNVDGVRYVITGGAGSPLYKHHGFNHFELVTVAGPTIRVKVIDRLGALRDRYMMIKERGREVQGAKQPDNGEGGGK